MDITYLCNEVKLPLAYKHLNPLGDNMPRCTLRQVLYYNFILSNARQINLSGGRSVLSLHGLIRLNGFMLPVNLSSGNMPRCGKLLIMILTCQGESAAWVHSLFSVAKYAKQIN